MPVEQLAQPADVLAEWPAYGTLPQLSQTRLLNTASAKILHFCRRRTFTQETVTDLFNGNGLSRVWLSTRPVISIMSLTINGVLIPNTSGNVYGFNARTGEFYRGSGHDDQRYAYRFPHGRQNIAVQYWAGCECVPDQIVLAAAWAVRWLHERGQVTGVYQAERIGNWNGNVAAEQGEMTLPSHIADLCADYVQDDGPL